MTAKEFVKSKFPRARAEKYQQGKIRYGSSTYYIVWSELRGQRLATADTEGKAWTAAKKNIIAKEPDLIKHICRLKQHLPL